MIEKKTLGYRLRVVIIYFLVVVLGFACFYPLWNMVCISLSNAVAISTNKVSVFPVGITLTNYAKIVDDARFWRAFGISTARVAISWVMSMPLMLMMAYAFTKSKQEFRGRTVFMGIMIVSMLFSGGLIPTYLWMKKLKLVNNFWIFVLPTLVGSSHIIMMMNFMKGLPYSIEEAAICDGASPWQILWRIIVPCSKPVIATISLFMIVGHWNDFMTGVIYINKAKLQPLMTYINTLNVDLKQLAISGNFQEIQNITSSGMSATGLNSAKIVVAMLPLLMIYPFLQRYLIQGLVLGAVKE